MKAYVRDQNTSFKLQDVHVLAAHWLAACDESTATGCFEQTKQYEAVFKGADHYAESIEETLINSDDDDNESDQSSDEDEYSSNNDDE